MPKYYFIHLHWYIPGRDRCLHSATFTYTLLKVQVTKQVIIKRLLPKLLWLVTAYKNKEYKLTKKSVNVLDK